jgi:hypothetical protein
MVRSSVSTSRLLLGREEGMSDSAEMAENVQGSHCGWLAAVPFCFSCFRPAVHKS